MAGGGFGAKGSEQFSFCSKSSHQQVRNSGKQREMYPGGPFSFVDGLKRKRQRSVIGPFAILQERDDCDTTQEEGIK